MLKVESIKTYNWLSAIKGMRNPLQSWDKMDSVEDNDQIVLGPNDKNLMIRLLKAGTEHRKYVRQIFVSFEVTAPIYWWKEFDQYKIGVTTNSTSTMHTIHKKPFKEEDFSFEHIDDKDKDYLLIRLNDLRELYLSTSNKYDWYSLIQFLPSSYNQTRMVSCNFENLLNIVQQRQFHKLDEWHTFIDTLYESIPFLKECIEELADL